MAIQGRVIVLKPNCFSNESLLMLCVLSNGFLNYSFYARGGPAGAKLVSSMNLATVEKFPENNAAVPTNVSVCNPELLRKHTA